MQSPLKCQALVLKVASRCNLNCTYCYMYNVGDTTYRGQPRLMSEEVVLATLLRVRTHCLRNNLRQFRFIFHGGEPLLAGLAFFEDFVRTARRLLGPAAVHPTFSLQSNGTLLTEEWCRGLRALHISLGISLDGAEAVNDKFRVDHRGRGTYRAIVRGVQLAQRLAPHASGPGVLCVIDVTADPLGVYRHLKGLALDRISFLLPYATHDQPPPGLEAGRASTPYADWLIAIFDEWFGEEAPKPKIQIFEQLIELIIGIDKGHEYWGRGKAEFLVVETDGGIEAAGALKVCGNGFTKAGVNVRTHELDEALDTELARQYQRSHQQLPAQCRRCPLVDVCGGGFLPHRYSKKNGFDNPSVLCADLQVLITHLQRTLSQTLSALHLPVPAAAFPLTPSPVPTPQTLQVCVKDSSTSGNSTTWTAGQRA